MKNRFCHRIVCACLYGRASLLAFESWTLVSRLFSCGQLERSRLGSMITDRSRSLNEFSIPPRGTVAYFCSFLCTKWSRVVGRVSRMQRRARRRELVLNKAREILGSTELETREAAPAATIERPAHSCMLVPAGSQHALTKGEKATVPSEFSSMRESAPTTPGSAAGIRTETELCKVLNPTLFTSPAGQRCQLAHTASSGHGSRFKPQVSSLVGLVPRSSRAEVLNSCCVDPGKILTTLT